MTRKFEDYTNSNQVKCNDDDEELDGIPVIYYG